MASRLLCKNLLNLGRRSLHTTAVRASGNDFIQIDPHKGKKAISAEAPTTEGHAVGLERYELLAEACGELDPFEMNVAQRQAGFGTAENPTLVQSADNERLVGCICDEETLVINWFTLRRGLPSRCECGYYFKLTPHPNPDYGH